MTGDDFRRIALGMTGAVEGAHMGHPDFRANGRIFATLRFDATIGMVGLTLDDQAELIRSYPRIFSPESGAWGRAGATRVELAVADEDTVGQAVTLAWKRVMEMKKSKSKAAKVAKAPKAKGSKRVNATRRSALKRPSRT
jgi:hypothetical protein